MKRRAWPLAVALAGMLLAGNLTDTVASAQFVAIAGPRALLVVYPMAGLGLAVAAIAQVTFIDQRPRMSMIGWLGVLYAAILFVGLVLLEICAYPGVVAGFVWVLADQLNFLFPVLLWSLAGDLFNPAEARRVFGWIVAWTYAGRIGGLGISVLSPPLLARAGVPLSTLLILPPLICLAVAFWLPRKLADAPSATGLVRPEGLRTSVRSVWSFVKEVPVWRHMVVGSLITFTAGMALMVSFHSMAFAQLGAGAGSLQMYFGSTYLLATLGGWLMQVLWADRLQNRLGVNGVLVIVPVLTVASGVLLSAGSAMSNIWLITIGMMVWLLPAWSVDEHARQSALAYVPDERRARVSLVLLMATAALSQILCAPLVAIGILTDRFWLAALTGAVLAAIALLPWRRFHSGWDDSMFNWRLRRRKRGLGFGPDIPTIEGQ